jgi:hypothetical protein
MQSSRTLRKDFYVDGQDIHTTIDQVAAACRQGHLFDRPDLLSGQFTRTQNVR